MSEAPQPPVVTAAQMRAADTRCIEEIGIPGPVLMDHAGKAVWKALKGRRIGVVCGKGNNGGDGYVTARYALVAGCEVSVVVLAEPEAITGDARIFLDAYRNLGGHVVVAHSEDEARAAVAGLSNCDVLVDAILGTGITGEVRGLARAAIEAWPARYTVAVDIPSGLNADTGEPCGCAVRAEKTITFQFMKQGLLQPAARDYTGQLEVVDIGIPACCLH